MGNSSSQQRAVRPDTHLTDSPGRRGRSTSPIPGVSSIGPKKKSIELPGFNRGSLTLTPSGIRGRPKTPPKSQAINIPKATPDVPFTRRPQNNFSSSELIVPATHLPFPPTQAQATQRSNSGYGSGRGHRSRIAPQRLTELSSHPSHHQEEYNEEEPATPPSPTPSGFNREVVKSSIPIGLTTELDLEPGEEEGEESALPSHADDSGLIEQIAVKITWQGGGKVVILARAGDDDWNGRQPMERENPLTNIWTATVHLLPGTHHIRFLVDDQWRVSDELPSAVDDQGSLANYVNVQPRTPPSQSSPLPPAATPTPTPVPPPPQYQHQQSTPPRPPQPGHSFWSTNSSVDEDDRPAHANALHLQIAQARWTSTLPPELIEAAREEESYLTASAGHYDAASRSVHVSGFVPAPNIPPAPGMPRHLDKLILNTKMTVPGQNNNSGSGGNSNTGSPSRGGMTGGIGSGQGGGRERERSGRKGDGRRRKGDDRDRERKDRKEREHERKDREQAGSSSTGAGPANTSWRDSAYTNFPPAPPPSEDGTGTGLDDKPEHSPVRGDVNSEGDTQALRQESVNTMTTTAPESMTTTPESASAVPSASTSTTATATAAATSTTNATTPTPTVSVTRHGSSTQPSSSTPSGNVRGSRAITLDMENMPALTDDGSVLPVPSHVVLQHLCTSAIRNGVLAVASTNRYRKKYMTTVYYKPTS